MISVVVVGRLFVIKRSSLAGWYVITQTDGVVKVYGVGRKFVDSRRGGEDGGCEEVYRGLGRVYTADAADDA